MNNDQKIELLEKLFFKHIAWLESYRATYDIPQGIGCPSGLTGAETQACLARTILRGEPVKIILMEDLRADE